MQRDSVLKTKTPAVEAKIYLKRSLEKSSELSRDNFRQVQKWLEKDEDTRVITRDFLNKTRNEMKRTLKLTLNRIKNPGNLGGYPKRDLSSKRAYPSLPTMKEEVGGQGTDRTEKWVNSNDINKPSAPMRDYEEDANSNPPNYDQSVNLQYRTTQNGPQRQFDPHFGQGMHRPMMPMNNVWASTGSNDYQRQFLGTGNIASREESEKEKKEQMKQALVKRHIPRDLWEYYLEIPEHWDHEDIDEQGLQRGLKAILMSPKTVTPYWVKKASMDKFVSLKMKLTQVIQAKAEIDRFVDEEMPEDNQLACEYKQAQK